MVDHQFRFLILVRPLSPLIAAFLAAEIAVAVLPRLRLRSAPLLHGMPDDPDQGQAVLPDRIGAPNSWVRLSDGRG